MNYTKEEAEEMAKIQYPKSGLEIIDEIIPISIQGYIIGRMSLAEECKTMESTIKKQKEIIEKLSGLVVKGMEVIHAMAKSVEAEGMPELGKMLMDEAIKINNNLGFIENEAKEL